MIPGGLASLFLGSAAKPFPTVVATNGGGDVVVNNSKTVTLPSWTFQSGDQILIGLGFYSDSGVTGNIPSGYTGITSQQSGRTHFRTVRKAAVGGDSGASVSVNANLNHFLGWTVQIIRGAENANPASATATAASGAPNCPSLSPGGGSDSYLWVAIEDAYGLTQTQSAPSGYSGLVAGLSNSGGIDWARVCSSVKSLATGTEDPPAYSSAIGTAGVTSPVWYGVTLGFKPI